MELERKFYRTVVEVEILSEDTYDFEDLDILAYDVEDGDCSGQCAITAVERVSPQQMAELLTKQGSDPEFFGLDANGNEVDDDIDDMDLDDDEDDLD